MRRLIYRSNQLTRKNRNFLIIISIVIVALFGFAYALVPFYNALCRVLGINGKTNNAAVVNQNQIDRSRTITVQFIANTNAHLPWAFAIKANLHETQAKVISV